MPKHQVEDLWYDEDTDQIYRRNKNGFIDLTVDLSSVSTAISSHASIVAGATLGHVKSGTDITVDGSGNVSVNDNSHSHVSANISNATADPTISTVVIRDSSGRAAFADPSAADDAATKGYVDIADSAKISFYSPAMTNHGSGVGNALTIQAGEVGKLCLLMGYGRKDATGQAITLTLGAGTYIVLSLMWGNASSNPDLKQALAAAAGTGQVYSSKVGKAGVLYTTGTVVANNDFKYALTAIRLS